MSAVSTSGSVAAAAAGGVQSVHWALITPVLFPAVAAVAVLVLDAVLPRALLARRGPALLDGLAIVSLGAAAIAAISLSGREDGTFCVGGGSGGCSYAVEPVTTGLQLVIVLAALVCLLLSIGQRAAPPRAEHHLLLLAATAGAVAVAGARDLPTLIVALETASLPAVGLVALRRNGSGAEAGLKLLLTSVLSVALLVLGVAMLYAACGTLQLGPLGHAGTLVPLTAQARGLAGLGLVLALGGIAFKLSLVPFHLWTPDTYAGAPLPIAAFLSAVSKAAALAGVIVLLTAGADLLESTWVPVVAALAILTMTAGNLVALRQSTAVRLLAWSTVAQAGWVILPLAGAQASREAAGQDAGAAVAYLAAYLVATLLAFTVVSFVARTAGEGHPLDAYRGLIRTRPGLAGCLLLALAALAGLPPGVVGLVAKVVALRPVVADDYWLVAAFAVANVALGIAVYLRWAAVVVAAPEPGGPAAYPALVRSRRQATRPERAALLVAATLAVLTSLTPQLVAGLAQGL